MALAGVAVPLALGCAVAYAAHGAWAEGPVDRTVFALLVGTGVSITAIGVVARLLLALEARGLPCPSTPLSLVVCLGLAGGVAASALGLHPVFGFLVAGPVAGDQRALSEHGRDVITQVALSHARSCVAISDSSLSVEVAVEHRLALGTTGVADGAVGEPPDLVG